MTPPRPAWTGRLVTAVTLLAVTAIALIAGIMLRPVIIDDDHGAAALLSTVEVGFLQDMSAHHQQALSMAQLIDRPGVDDGVRSLARQIRVAQANEIGTMTGWLLLADQPLVNPAPMSWMTRYGTTGGMHDHGAAHTTMPGMATADDLSALASLPPAAAATRFLQLMQRHHYGGIAMAQDLVAQVPDGLTRQLARSMIGTQSKETGLMGTMLTQRGP
ncbi:MULTISPECIES: DUF305 domain-containing protein [Gordonia]|uniref:DUF305 domain-containing protein n=1 Tax=Gordonia TaxID=2053 RepID=UPI0025C4A303|nr:DUF305 domain-containing protein [Gordonia sp. UBA5067]